MGAERGWLAVHEFGEQWSLTSTELRWCSQADLLWVVSKGCVMIDIGTFKSNQVLKHRFLRLNLKHAHRSWQTVTFPALEVAASLTMFVGADSELPTEYTEEPTELWKATASNIQQLKPAEAQ